jgi:hypothetical protein
MVAMADTVVAGKYSKLVIWLCRRDYLQGIFSASSGYNNRGYDRGYGQQSGYGTDAATSSGTSGAGYDYSQYYGYYNQGSGEAGDNGKIF